MTPKEKAEELVSKYRDTIMSFLSDNMKDMNAKKCALLAVDEILNNNCGSTTDYGVNAEDNELYIDEYYWFEVKQEIQAL